MNAAGFSAVTVTSSIVLLACSSNPRSLGPDDTAFEATSTRSSAAPLGGCGDSPSGRGDSGLPDRTGEGGVDQAHDGATDASGTWAFSACAADADCVSVARVGCCHNGWLEAVNRDEADAYEASFHCPNPHPICPLYIVRDARIAACDSATGHCVMVNPSDAAP
jgi:hypothetical protein